MDGMTGCTTWQTYYERLHEKEADDGYTAAELDIGGPCVEFDSSDGSGDYGLGNCVSFGGAAYA